jgi:hypothetical protein
MSDNDGRRVLDEMVKAGVSPDEVTLTTLLKVGATFNEGCELAVFARDDRVGSVAEVAVSFSYFRLAVNIGPKSRRSGHPRSNMHFLQIEQPTNTYSGYDYTEITQAR